VVCVCVCVCLCLKVCLCVTMQTYTVCIRYSDPESAVRVDLLNKSFSVIVVLIKT